MMDGITRYILPFTKFIVLVFLLVSILRTLPGKMMEAISLNITKFNIHAMVIIGGFEVWNPGPPHLISQFSLVTAMPFTLKW